MTGVSNIESELEDRVGKIEQTGTEFIPEAGRDSSPGTVFSVFTGANFGWPTVIFGWLPVALGLDFWGAFTSTLVGTVIAAALVAPLAILGPKTGTTVPVASGAHFGIHGRLIGSGLALVASLAYAAIAVWTCGDAIVSTCSRLFGLPDGDLMKAASYAVVAFGFTIVALYGYATISAIQKIIVPVVGVILLVGVYVFAGGFDPHHTVADYALGSYWPTWFLSLAIGVSGPISYAPYIGDYTRKISELGTGKAQVMAAVAGGLIVGLLLPTTFGIFTSVTFVGVSDSYVSDLVAAAPTWFVLPILVVAILGGVGQGVLCIYGTGLDLRSFIPRMPRVQTTALTAFLAICLVYLGVFAVDATAALSTATLVLNAMTVPWVAVLVIAALRHWTRRYDTNDLQAFAQRRRGGRYWFAEGWNIAAVVAWLAGAAFGVLAVETDLYTGPLAGLLGGIDVSVAGSFLIASAVYLAAIFWRPARVDAPEPVTAA